MMVRKWVDFGLEVEVEIGMDDVRGALAESFSNVTEDRLGEPGPSAAELKGALNQIATFLRAVTDEQVGMLNGAQRNLIHDFLMEQASRYLGDRVANDAAPKH